MSRRKQDASRIPLSRCHLHGLRSPHALARRLGWELDKLESLAANGSYAVYPHPTTRRIIEQPGDALQSLHKQLHRYLSRVEVPDYLHSCVKGRSYLSNAKAHVGDGGLIKIDVEKFYRSVKRCRIMHFFRDKLECAPDVAALLANLVCFQGHLPTGSSASPIISYFAFQEMFDELADLASQNKLRMTSYVDDISMSGQKANFSVIQESRSIIRKHGFLPHKERCFSPKSPKIVTGLVVGEKDVRLPYSRWKDIRNATRALGKLVNDGERIKAYPALISRLYEAAQIEPSCRILAELHRSDWLQLRRRSDVVT